EHPHSSQRRLMQWPPRYVVESYDRQIVWHAAIQLFTGADRAERGRIVDRDDALQIGILPQRVAHGAVPGVDGCLVHKHHAGRLVDLAHGALVAAAPLAAAEPVRWAGEER